MTRLALCALLLLGRLMKRARGHFRTRWPRRCSGRRYPAGELTTNPDFDGHFTDHGGYVRRPMPALRCRPRSGRAQVAIIAALLLALAGCGAFHRSETVKAGKDAVKALPDLIDSIRALVAAITVFFTERFSAVLAAVQRGAERLDEMAPVVTHAVETIDGTAHVAGYALWTGGASLVLLIAYVVWHRVTDPKRHARYSRAPK